MEKPIRIGIDFGKVIVAAANDESTSSFFAEGGGYLMAMQNEGVMTVVRRLVERYGADNVFIVSKCGQRIQARTLGWLDYNSFYSKTGLQSSNVYFCRERRDKAGICRALGISIFIDDRPEVLFHIARENEAARLILFQGKERELHRYPNLVVERVSSWAGVAELLLT